jgi:hypothetical protein
MPRPSDPFDFIEWVIVRSTAVVLLIIAAYQLIVAHLR